MVSWKRALITVTGFARPRVLIEVQGIAVVGDTRWRVDLMDIR